MSPADSAGQPIAHTHGRTPWWLRARKPKPSMANTTVPIDAATTATPRHHRVSSRPRTTAHTPTASAHHGAVLGGGTHNSRPSIDAVCPSTVIGSVQWSMITCVSDGSSCGRPAAAVTSIQWVRWSCHRTLRPEEICSHSGAALESAVAGMSTRA